MATRSSQKDGRRCSLSHLAPSGFSLRKPSSLSVNSGRSQPLTTFIQILVWMSEGLGGGPIGMSLAGALRKGNCFLSFSRILNGGSWGINLLLDVSTSNHLHISFRYRHGVPGLLTVFSPSTYTTPPGRHQQTLLRHGQ